MPSDATLATQRLLAYWGNSEVMHEIFLPFFLKYLSTTKDERHDSGVEDYPSDLNSEFASALR